MISGNVVGRGLPGSRRWRRRRRGPPRLAGGELVEHRRDVVPDLAVQLSCPPPALKPNQEFPSQARRPGHSGDRRFVSFLPRRSALGTRLGRPGYVNHSDLDGRLAGPSAGHCGDVAAPARAPHGASPAACVEHRRPALRAPLKLLPRHESTVSKRRAFRITESSRNPGCMRCAVDGVSDFSGGTFRGCGRLSRRAVSSRRA